ncbi:uncharacterized protein LOC121902129 isoform X1, partial [Xyrichtys novacula]
MPKLKGWRRSQAATRRLAQREFLIVGPQGHSDGMPTGTVGTGYRHRVNQWPISVLTGRQHKLVIPPEVPDKKFVLIVGDSHLRPFVDGVVPLPEGRMSFGFMSTPGACADGLRIEMVHAAVPRNPDLVIVMAPSNNLTTQGSLEKSSTDFAKLLSTAVGRWFKVIVYDFPPRLNHPLHHQELLRQEFCQVAARMGIQYVCPAADDFPLRRLKLWCRDSVHLSDDGGSPILGQRLWQAAYTELERGDPASVLSVSRRRPPPLNTVTPKVVVRGEVPAPQPSSPFEWTVCGKVHKQNLSGNEVEDSATCTQQLSTVGLQDCFLRLNPIHFSAHLLDAMEKISPSQLHNPVPHDDEMPRVEPRRTVVASRRIPTRKQGRTLRDHSPAELQTTEVPPATEVTSPEVDLERVAEVQTCPGVVTVNTAILSAPQPDGGIQVEQVSMRKRPLSPPLVFGDFDRSPVQVSSVETDAVQFLCSQIEGEMSDLGCVRHSVMGSFHQGSDLFSNPGQQCMAIGLASVAKHSVKSVFSWSVADLDTVLLCGDQLYTYLRDNDKISGGTDFLCIPDLPASHTIDGMEFDFEYGDYMSGLINQTDGSPIAPGLTTLLHSLQILFAKYDTCFLTLHCSTCVVIRENNMFAVVDSHARNALGLHFSHQNLSPSRKEKRLTKYLKRKKFLQMKINYHRDFLDYNRRNQNVRNTYKHNLLYQQKLKDLSKRKYFENYVHRQDVIERSKIKYRDDKKHREDVKSRSQIKYRDNKKHREDVKNRSIIKYRDNKKHREDVKSRSQIKYRDDKKYRQILKERSREISKVKYRNAAFQQKNLDSVRTKYRQVNKKVLASKKLKRLERKAKLEQVDL